MKLQRGLGVCLLVAGLTACSNGQGTPAVPDVQTPAAAAVSTTVASGAPAAAGTAVASGAPAAVGTTVASGVPNAVATSIAEGTPQAAVRAGFGPGIAGTVQSVNGTTITIQPRQQGAAPMTIQLSDTTTIRKQVVGAITDLKVGDAVAAFGQTSGNVLQAQQIALRNGQGQAPGQGQGRGGNGTPGAGNGTPRAGNGNSAVIGTIQSISGDTITVQTNAGTTMQVQLAQGGRILEQAAATAQDIVPGTFITATGQQQGNNLVASFVNLSTAALNGAGTGQAPAG